MFKCNKLLGASLAVIMGVSACATNVFAIDTSVIDEKWGKPTVVYGGGLTNDQIQSTRDLFDIEDTNNVYETSVDANDLYNYLGIAGGDTSSLISSVMVQKQDAGKGVKVKIITEDNITKITSNQYANAAITAGVSDVEIDVASVSKVTGESALTGVYKALESSVDIMPPRLQKLIANYYTDARIRKLYFDRLGVKMGEGSFANLGMKIIVSSNHRYSIEIGDNVSIGPNLTLVTEAAAGNGKEINTLPYVKEKLTKEAKIYIEDEVWIGANVVILPGVRVGRCSVIGAGAVVNSNVEPYSVYAGVPARKIRDLEKE